MNAGWQARLADLRGVMSAAGVDAAAIVWPLASSMTWT